MKEKQYQRQYNPFTGRGLKQLQVPASPFWQMYWAFLNSCSFGLADIARQETEHTLVEAETATQQCIEDCINTIRKAQASSGNTNDSIELSLEKILGSTQKELMELWVDHCSRIWTLPLRAGQSAEGQKRFPVTLEGEWQ